MYKKLLDDYKKEISRNYENAKKIANLINDKELIKDVYMSSIISMCINYEALTSDLEAMVYEREPRYNHPWANTRNVADNFNIDISKEYKVAHDVWDLYNSLKHINEKTQIDQHKLLKKYELRNMKEASFFAMHSLIKLIDKFIKK